MTDDDKALYLSATIEEYKTLRDESKQASINMFAALQLGAGFVGLTLAAGLTQWGRSTEVSVVVFMILVPLLGAFSTFIWLGEAIRLKRAGDYLAFLEQKVGLLFSTSGAVPHMMKELLPSLQRKAEAKLGLVSSPIYLIDPLGWEQWLRNTRSHGIAAFFLDTSGHQQLVYGVRFGFFPLIAALSYCIGLYYVETHPPSLRLVVAGIDSLCLAKAIGVLVIGVTVVLGGIITWKLSAKAEPIRRNELFAEFYEHDPTSPPETR